MGQDRFVENVLAQADEVPVLKPGIEEVLAAVGQLYQLTPDALASSSQDRRLTEARSLAAWAVQRWTDASLTQLGSKVGREVSSLSSASRRFELRRMNDSGCEEKVDRLKQVLNLAILQS